MHPIARSRSAGSRADDKRDTREKRQCHGGVHEGAQQASLNIGKGLSGLRICRYATVVGQN